MKKTLNLCGVCAAKLGTAYTLRKVASDVNQKIICAHCGKPRYGATFEVTKKGGSADA